MRGCDAPSRVLDVFMRLVDDFRELATVDRLFKDPHSSVETKLGAGGSDSEPLQVGAYDFGNGGAPIAYGH